MANGARLWFDVLSPEIGVLDAGVVARRPVVGVHGGPGIDSTAMAGVLSPLGDVAHTLRYDQRGHGRSEHGVPADWTVQTWADDLAELCRGLGLEQPVLLGTSFGARVALTCAARHPDLVAGVIAAYGGARLDEHQTIEAFRRLGGDRVAAVAAGRPEDPEASFREWIEVCWPLVSRSPSGAAHLARMQQLSMHSPDVHAVHMAQDLEREPVPELQAVRCPVLVLGGADDPLSTPALMVELADSLTDRAQCRLVLIPGAGHPVFLDRPDQAYAEVRAFLAGLPPLGGRSS